VHPTALHNCQAFFKCYGADIAATAPIEIIDVGSQDVNGSLKQTCPPDSHYVGVDFVAGPGVDVVLSDPYSLPFPANSADVVLSSSCFEHSELFWVLFLEILRVLKPGGLFYLNVPSNGHFHRWPVDCWRFYPDSGRALTKWAARNGVDAALLESYTSSQFGDQWNDFVAVFIKDTSSSARYPRRIVNTLKHYSNALVLGSDEFLNFKVLPEDQRKLALVGQIVNDQVKVL
jgi:SAM-dependent methyltransferase